MGNVDFSYLYTSLEGRIGRQSYWIGVVGFIIVALIVYLIIGAIFGVFSTVGLILILIFQVALLYPSYALMAKRFQDRDKPATYALILLGLSILIALLNLFGLTHDAIGAPTTIGWIFSIVQLIVGIWFLVELGFLRGTIGPNQYGADPVAGT